LLIFLFVYSLFLKKELIHIQKIFLQNPIQEKRISWISNSKKMGSL